MINKIIELNKREESIVYGGSETLVTKKFTYVEETLINNTTVLINSTGYIPISPTCYDQDRTIWETLKYPAMKISISCVFFGISASLSILIADLYWYCQTPKNIDQC